jgi:hypothetical protein
MLSSIYVSQVVPSLQAFRPNVDGFLLAADMLHVFKSDSAP